MAKKISRDIRHIDIRCSRVVFRNTSLAKFTASGIADRISIKEEQPGYRDGGGREKFKAVSSVIWRRLIAGDAEERRGATEGERENAKETGRFASGIRAIFNSRISSRCRGQGDLVFSCRPVWKRKMKKGMTKTGIRAASGSKKERVRKKERERDEGEMREKGRTKPHFH